MVMTPSANVSRWGFDDVVEELTDNEKPAPALEAVRAVERENGNSEQAAWGSARGPSQNRNP
jgi:hypothetical protein